MSFFRLTKLSSKLPHLLRSGAHKKNTAWLSVAHFSSEGDNNNENDKQNEQLNISRNIGSDHQDNGVAHILREILSDDDNHDINHDDNDSTRFASSEIENLTKENDYEAGKGRRNIRNKGLKNVVKLEYSDFNIANLDAEVERHMDEDDQADEGSEEFYDEPSHEDDDSLSDDDEDDEDMNVQPGVRRVQKSDYLEKLESAAYLVNPLPEDMEVAEAYFNKMKRKKGDLVDKLIRESFWGSLKTEDGVYRLFVPNPAVRRVRIPKARSLSQLQHSLESKLTADPNSLGFKFGLQGWNIVSRNFYYTDRQKFEVATGLVDKVNRLEQYVKKMDKKKIDIIFSEDFQRGLPHVRAKGKEMRSKKRSQVIQRLKKA